MRRLAEHTPLVSLTMDIVTFRRRVLEIQAELEALDPTEPGAADRATALGAEVDALAAQQRERTARVAARAFGQTVTPTGLDTPVDTLTTLVDRVEAATAPEDSAPTRPSSPPEPASPPEPSGAPDSPAPPEPSSPPGSAGSAGAPAPPRPAEAAEPEESA